LTAPKKSLARLWVAAARNRKESSQLAAYRYWNRLRDVLDLPERNQLYTAWERAIIHSDPAELDRLAQELVDRGL
jgi:hypothetical protein